MSEDLNRVFNGRRLAVETKDFSGVAGVAVVRGVTTLSYFPNKSERVKVGDTITVDGHEEVVASVASSDGVRGMRLISLVRRT